MADASARATGVLTDEVLLAQFAPRAQMAIKAGAQAAKLYTANTALRPVLDTRWLLVGLCDDVSLWPRAALMAAIREAAATYGRTLEGMEGRLSVGGIALSTRAALALSGALRPAPEWSTVRGAEHVLYTLAEQAGSDASMVMRQVTRTNDAWREVRDHVLPKLGAFNVRLAGPSTPRDRIVALLYVLMRDHVPTSKIEDVTRQLQEGGPFDFTAKELEALATRYASRLFDVEHPMRRGVLDP